jgi:hypothetical protein
MCAAYQPASFQPRQIAPDAGRRRAGHGQQLFYGGGSRTEKILDDLLGTATDRIGHITAILLCPHEKYEGEIEIVTSNNNK